MRQEILDRLARAKNTTINPAAGPTSRRPLWTAGHTYAAEQRRLAAPGRADVSSLLADLRAQLDHGRTQRRNAADDRRAAASDRLASDQDRRSAARDRDESAGDLGQAAFEREQADPRDIVAAQRRTAVAIITAWETAERSRRSAAK